MSDASDGWVTNLLAALSVHVADQVAAATSGGSRQSTSDTEALIAVACVVPGLSQDKLGGMLQLSQSAVTRLVDRLVADGLVWRDAGRDQRTVALRATLRGQKSAAAAVQLRHASAAQVLAALEPAEQEQLAGLLQKLLAGATRSRADAARICRLCDPSMCHDLGRCPVTIAANGATIRSCGYTEGEAPSTDGPRET